MISSAGEVNINIHSFNTLISTSLEIDFIPSPRNDSVYTLCYTSGTTGDSKGSMITHSNMLLSIEACRLQLADYNFTCEDVYLSYLPLTHMMERATV